MIAALVLLATALSPASAEAWTETFVIESMIIDGASVEVATIGTTGSPKRLCIPKADAKELAGWLRNRDLQHCRITAETVQPNRLRLDASCMLETDKANRKVVDIKIGHHSYSGTYNEFGRDVAGRKYRLTGRIEARRVGICAA